jgi:hypothetical protein
MQAFQFAQKIISTLSLDPLLPGYSAITFAIADKTQGKLGGYVDSSGNLVLGGIATSTLTSLGSGGNFDFSGSSGLLKFPQGGAGYATGAGGTVSQAASSKSNAVTLHKPSGQITMYPASLAAGTIVSFTLTNSHIAATDTLVLNHVSGGTPGSYTLNAEPAAGSAVINVRNNTAGALSEAIVVGFNLIKGTTN